MAEIFFIHVCMYMCHIVEEGFDHLKTKSARNMVEKVVRTTGTGSMEKLISQRPCHIWWIHLAVISSYK
jgi:hypothetical protein